MSTDAERNYAFEQGRTKHAVNHNNRLYHALDRCFAELRKRFRDFWVFNCTPESGLKSLPCYPYEKAVEYARTECSKPMDTAGWYDSANKSKPAANGQQEPLDERREHERQKYV